VNTFASFLAFVVDWKLEDDPIRTTVHCCMFSFMKNSPYVVFNFARVGERENDRFMTDATDAVAEMQRVIDIISSLDEMSR
jgi:hypothetical protein